MEKVKDHKTRDFLSVTNKADLARVLEVPYKILMYYLYIIPREEKYFSFEILKRNGKTRQIDAPKDGLKRIQKNWRRYCISYILINPAYTDMPKQKT